MPDFDDDNAPIDRPRPRNAGPAIDSHGEGLREAAAEVRQQRQDDDPPTSGRSRSLEDGTRPAPLEETIEINYLDRQNAPEKVSLKKAATDLGDYRAQQKQAAEDQLEIERMQTTDADPQQRAAELRQYQEQQQAQQQAQQPTLEQVLQHERALTQQSRELFQQAAAQSVRNFTRSSRPSSATWHRTRTSHGLRSGPVRFARFQQLVGHLRQTDQEVRQMQAHEQQQEQIAFQEYAKCHDDLAVQAIPELQRPEIKDHFKSAALETLRERGFADEELSRGYHGKGLFSLRDSRVQQSSPTPHAGATRRPAHEMRRSGHCRPCSVRASRIRATTTPLERSAASASAWAGPVISKMPLSCLAAQRRAGR